VVRNSQCLIHNESPFVCNLPAGSEESLRMREDE
jgi:hypothetical protein